MLYIPPNCSNSSDGVLYCQKAEDHAWHCRLPDLGVVSSSQQLVFTGWRSWHADDDCPWLSMTIHESIPPHQCSNVQHFTQCYGIIDGIAMDIIGHWISNGVVIYHLWSHHWWQHWISLAYYDIIGYRWAKDRFGYPSPTWIRSPFSCCPCLIQPSLLEKNTQVPRHSFSDCLSFDTPTQTMSAHAYIFIFIVSIYIVIIYI